MYYVALNAVDRLIIPEDKRLKIRVSFMHSLDVYNCHMQKLLGKSISTSDKAIIEEFLTHIMLTFHKGSYTFTENNLKGLIKQSIMEIDKEKHNIHPKRILAHIYDNCITQQFRILFVYNDKAEFTISGGGGNGGIDEAERCIYMKLQLFGFTSRVARELASEIKSHLNYDEPTAILMVKD